jgi:hypothetical protein
VTCSIQFDTRCPLARPSGGSPPTLTGALPPSSLSLAVSQLSACMCLSRESCFVLYCLHSCPPYVCVSINMNERLFSRAGGRIIKKEKKRGERGERLNVLCIADGLGIHRGHSRAQRSACACESQLPDLRDPSPETSATSIKPVSGVPPARLILYRPLAKLSRKPGERGRERVLTHSLVLVLLHLKIPHGRKARS